MPEGVGYSGSNVVASVGRTFQYIGDRIFGYSGEVGVNNVETIMFEDKVGSRYALVNIRFNYIQASDDNFEYFVYLNDVVVQGYQVSAAHLYTGADNGIELLIPPFNTLKLSAINLSNSTALDQIVSVVGKLYK